MLFQDRTAAGRLLAKDLADYANRPGVVVLALPRGGVPVAFEVAKILNTPLDILVVRKLGVPNNEELAMGAIASGGVRILNEDIVRQANISAQVIDQIVAREQQELERREQLYRDNRPFPDLKGCIVILVDDGLATGATMSAAVVALRQHQPARIVVAVPVAAPQTCQELRPHVDEVICSATPSPFYSVGLWYKNFPQTRDDEVRDLLAKAANNYQSLSRGT
jgi:putative phosphoribosyl transferase